VTTGFLKGNLNLLYIQNVLTRDKPIQKNLLRFKGHLLEQECIRTLYRNILKGKLTLITGKVDTDWLKMKKSITETAEESIGYIK
jgi:hypothetical protein